MRSRWKKTVGRFSLLLPFFAAIVLLLAWACFPTATVPPPTPMFEALPAFGGLLSCLDTSTALRCLSTFKPALLRQCRKLLSRSAYTQFHQCLGRLLPTQTETRLALSAQQCFHMASLRDVERGLARTTPPLWWLVVLVVVSQAFSVACVSFISHTHKKLAAVVSPANREPLTESKLSDHRPHRQEDRDKNTLSLVHDVMGAAHLHLSRAGVSDSRPDFRASSREQKLHMPTTILPTSGKSTNTAKPSVRIDENVPKPSFNISTPEGRFQMKQYVRERLERTQNAKLWPTRSGVQ